MAQTSQFRKSLTEADIVAALGAALLFGAGTPLAKLLLRDISPWLMAALLYLGSGIGLGIYRLIRRSPPIRLAPGEWPWHERHYSCEDKEQDPSQSCGTIFCERKRRDNRQQNHGCLLTE